MIRKSFRSTGYVLPRRNPRKLAPILLIAFVAGCGGSSAEPIGARQIRGNGFAFRLPAGWEVSRSARAVTAKKEGALVSVTVFRLARAYRPQLWASVVPELNRVATQLAHREQGKVTSSQTTTVAGVRARSYDIERGQTTEHISFVLVGKREYQLFCGGEPGPACSLMQSSFEFRDFAELDVGTPTS